MNLLPLSARLAAAALAAAVAAPTASAQRIATPVGVVTPTLGGGSVRGAVQPRLQRVRQSPPQYRVAGYGSAGLGAPVVLPYPQPAPHANPIVGQEGFVDTEYDPFTDVTDVNRQSVTTRDSALDPHRGVVDPGSLRQVDRWIHVNGKLVREHGTTWNSYGVPHGNLTRDSSTFTPHPTPQYPTPYPPQS